MQGSFRVTESGAAEYRIPLRVPPGVAGMEPKLALAYNSQSGNGLLGVGWSLEGLSAITRCPRTVAQDGVHGAVNYDSNDRFCLEGQRLVPASGSYAGYGNDGFEYRTERESFTRIVSYESAGNGPKWFKVWTKSGQIIEYGSSADSRMEIQANDTVRVWAVSTVSDRNGNSIVATYFEDRTNGEYRPHELIYAGGSVRFVHDARPDVVRSYEAGSLISLTHRLSKVQTYVGAAPVAELRLAYDEQLFSSRRSRLASATLCSGATCFPATTFAWQESGATFAYAGGTAIGIGWIPEREWIPMDVNGDGRKDMVIRDEGGHLIAMLSTGTGFNQAAAGTVTGVGMVSGRQWFPMDVNGDGRADLVVRLESGHLHTFLSTGAAFQHASETAIAIGWSPEREWIPMDVNGDGRTDMVIRDEGGNLLTFLSTGTGFAANPTGTATGIGMVSSRQWFPMDVNGDGRADLVLRAENGHLHTFLSTGAAFQSLPVTEIAISWIPEREWIPMDVNGDGRTDMVVRLENGDLVTFLSTGTGFSLNPAGIATGISTASGRQWFAMDVNGDGRSDLVVRHLGGDLHTFLSNGAGFSSPAYTPGGISAVANRQWFPMDVNGDGSADLVIRMESGHLQILTGPTSAPDLVTSFADGLDTVVSASYQPITQSSVYTKDSGAEAASHPTMDWQTPLQVVASDTLSGSGTALTRFHTYGGLKLSLDGRGSLGFRWLESVSQGSGLKVRTEHRQDWPYVGLPSLVKKMQSSGALLSEVANTYSALAAGNRYFPFVSRSEETGYDLKTGAALPKVTTDASYDAYGNPVSVEVDSGGGYRKITTNIYAPPDPVIWLPGRLVRSTVQSTSP
jgi:hypothetical protein